MKGYIVQALLISLMIALYYLLSEMVGNEFSVIFTVILILGVLVITCLPIDKGFVQGMKQLGVSRFFICLIFSCLFSALLSGVRFKAFLDVLPFFFFMRGYLFSMTKCFRWRFIEINSPRYNICVEKGRIYFSPDRLS